MSKRKLEPGNALQRSLEEAANAIFKKAEEREKAGCDSFEAGWQAALELMLLMMKKHLLENPGQLLPMQISGEEEWEFYLDVQEKLDLPPDVCAILITPSAFKDMPLQELSGIESIGSSAWERNAYSIILSDCRDHTVIMQVSLPGLETIGIDVFEDGRHFADYRYDTIEACLNDLAKITWIHFNPEGEWTEELIIRYTENWFAKTLEIDLENAVVHEQNSYVHHPELLNLSPLEAAFKVIVATIPREFDGLEKAIQIANDLNRDFELGDPEVTKEGILQDNEEECKSLLAWIGVEIDQHLDTLEYVEGVQFSRRSIRKTEYRRTFDEIAKRAYKVITGRPCPESVKIS